MNIYGENIFNQKPVISRWNIQMEADFLQDITFPPCNQTEKRRKLMKNVSKRLPSLLKLNAFRVLSYLFDYLQFRASLLLNISLPSTLIFLGDARQSRKCIWKFLRLNFEANVVYQSISL